MQTETGKQAPIIELTASDRLWVLMLLAPVAMDYRFDDNVAGSIGLYTTVLVLNLFGAWRLVERYGLPVGNALSATLIVGIIFVVTALFGGVIYGSDLVSLLRTGSPMIVYVVVLIGIGALSRSGVHPGAIWRLAMAMAAVGLVFQVVMVALFRGVNFATLRYEVLTGATPGLFALAIVAIVYGGWRFRYLAYSALLAILVFISITRTYLLVGCMILLALVIVSPLRTLTQRSLARSLWITPLVMLAVLAVDAVFPVSQLDRWWGRLAVDHSAHRGIDLTEMTRLSEAGYQLGQLEGSTAGLFVGFGPAAQTRFDDQAAALLTYFIGNSYGGEWRGGGFGHNNYIGTIYVGGIIAGTLLLLSQFLALVQAPGLLRRFGRLDHGEERLLLMSIPAALIGYMVLCFASGTMGARSSAALFAATVGMVWWLKSYATSRDSPLPQLRQPLSHQQFIVPRPRSTSN